ncbi:NAD-dependent epimerase [Marmoricola endophyticus]|uniref:NAD-dependent epimerase n=1 Tax=Marmoricola endophyticus TaxID=2040280 RepID=A0A917BMY0_9ACTN|nr:NAD(P)-dependent oxidoreductase [Marmoricola endophyticus]GGF51236.1 NAD-dependent epimerase [Marmoricola endophyticus]
MILVTGGAGFIGTHTVRALCDAGEECLLAQRRSPVVPDSLTDLPVHVAQVDVTDLDALLTVGREHPVTGIVNLALALPWPSTDVPPVDGVRTGVDGFLNVVQAAQEWGVRRVVSASTIGVYGDRLAQGGALTEDLPLSLGRSHPIPTFKKTAELLGGFLSATSEVDVVTARVNGNWGPGGHQPDPFFAPPSLAYAAAHRVAPDFSQMEVAPHAEDSLDFSYVKDTGRALAMLQLADELQHTTYNVASGFATSNAEVVEALRRIEPSFEAHLPDAEVPPRTWLDTERLRTDTGFEPEWDLERSAADYVTWLRDGHER